MSASTGTASPPLARPGRSGGAGLHRFEADAAVGSQLHSAGSRLGDSASAGGGTADQGADDRCVGRDARLDAKEIEERVTRPMEKLLWEIPGSSTCTRPRGRARASVIVRFQVGREIERSLVKLDQKLDSNFDRIPTVSPSADQAQVDRRCPDSRADVSQCAAGSSDAAALGRAGGRRGQAGAARGRDHAHRRGAAPGARVVRSRAAGVAQPEFGGVIPMLQQANRQTSAGGLTSDNREIAIETGAFLTSAQEVGNVVIGVFGGRPVICAMLRTWWTGRRSRRGTCSLAKGRPGGRRRGLWRSNRR